MPDPIPEPVPDTDVARHVRQARHGSQPSFAFLYRRFSPLVHGILLGRFSPAVADELTQECFVTAFARMEQLHDDGKFGAWIAVIARRARSNPAPGTTPGADLDAIRCEAASPDEVADTARILRAIADLPEAYRETLMLRLAEGMSGPQIAELTGLTHASVRVNLHRGMAKLRTALGLTQGAATEARHD